MQLPPQRVYTPQAMLKRAALALIAAMFLCSDGVSAQASKQGISLDEAVSRAQKQYRARVVRTEVRGEDGRRIYVLRLLSDDGRVWTVRIDAASGRET